MEPFRTVRVFVSVTNVAAIAYVITGSVMILTANLTSRREAATIAVVRRTVGWTARCGCNLVHGYEHDHDVDDDPVVESRGAGRDNDDGHVD